LCFSADPGVRDAEGCAPIHVAVQLSFTHIVAYLIAKGTDPDLIDANGKTPLMWATFRTYGLVHLYCFSKRLFFDWCY